MEKYTPAPYSAGFLLLLTSLHRSKARFWPVERQMHLCMSYNISHCKQRTYTQKIKKRALQKLSVHSKALNSNIDVSVHYKRLTVRKMLRFCQKSSQVWKGSRLCWFAVFLCSHRVKNAIFPAIRRIKWSTSRSPTESATRRAASNIPGARITGLQFFPTPVIARHSTSFRELPANLPNLL